MTCSTFKPLVLYIISIFIKLSPDPYVWLYSLFARSTKENFFSNSKSIILKYQNLNNYKGNN